MGFQLTDTLRRLCDEIGWSYAVFWRVIGDRNPMHLVWEYGHWDRGSMSSGVELLVNKIMAPQAHVIGDGIIGQAASTGSHLWILRDLMNIVGLTSKDLANLNHQFLAGIQTIVIIPALPLGVLQLGSSQMVMENIGFVNSVTNFFAQLGCARVLLPPICKTVLAHSNRPYNGVPPTASEGLQDNMPVAVRSVPLICSSQPQVHPKEENKVFSQRDHLKAVQGILVDLCPGYSSNSSQSVLKEGNEKEEIGLSQGCDVPSSEFNANGCSQALLSTQEHRFNGSDTAHEDQIFYSSACAANGVYTGQNSQNSKDNDMSKLHNMFPIQRSLGDDLYDVLGPTYKVDDGSFDCAFVHVGDASVDELVKHISTCTTQLDACPDSYSLIDGISGSGMFSGADTDQLLDAVVSKINFDAKQSSDDHLYSKTSASTNIANCSLPDVSPYYKSLASSELMQQGPLGISHALGKAEAGGSSSVISSSSLGNLTECCSQGAGVSKSPISQWSEGQSLKTDDLSAGTHSKKVDENCKLNRKRSRPGENPRQRPKDRQMIMDRVKELREIIPNGAKLSIDALLEKTIKHMFFLQGVTKHAEKLKDIGEPKFINREGGSLLKENFKGGATWAYEVGAQPMTCPIIVEDLNPPRQMLIEMLCEQRGFFLEIADLIRGLGLTILKGVMEVRKDKIWARFAVEANRDVTRMEIFLSLVRLLEPAAGGSLTPQESSSTPQGANNINLLHNMYHRSCIPASGPSRHLQ